MGQATGNPEWKDYPDESTPVTAQALNNIEDALDGIGGGGESARSAVVTVPNAGWAGSVTLPVAGLTGPHVVSPVTAEDASTWAAGGWWASSPEDGYLTITGEIQSSADPADIRIVWWE